MRVAKSLVLPLLVVPFGLVASCALVTTWDGLTSDASADAASDRADDGSSPAPAEDARRTESGGNADVDAGRCVAGELTCAGPLFAGDPKIVYRCLPDGGAVVHERCANVCEVLEGRDDRCQCVPNSTYCGGDRVDGDRGSLYKCLADGGASFVEACPDACAVNPGDDDSCK